jgi:NADH-quinone oxidoreductase subunit A
VNLENYFPVLLFIVIGTVVGVASQVLGRVVGPHRPDPAKLSPYECGFEAFEDARMKFDVRYYLVAIWKRHSSSPGAFRCANWACLDSSR